MHFRIDPYRARVGMLPSRYKTRGSPVDFSLSTATNATTFSTTSNSSKACDSLHSCRTLYDIVWGSLVTIFACVWTAVHRNVPGPPRDNEPRLRQAVVRLLEVGKIVGVTLLAPEWVLAWAVRQFLNARVLGQKLEEARAEASAAWEAKGWVDGGGCIGGKSTSINPWDAEKDDRVPLTRKSSFVDTTGGSVKDGQVDKLAVEGGAGRLRGKWTTKHGFFIIMGGFHFYEDGEPLHPLPWWDVVELVKLGNLVPPTEAEIRGWSQGDVLSKAIAIIQTLWFVIQCVARRFEGLPITQLEVMTLAYTVITVAMYVAWWDKPQNIGVPVRVAGRSLPAPAKALEIERFWRIFAVITGAHDMFVDLREPQAHVPTFYGGSVFDEHHEDIIADVVAVVVAMVFGGVHCTAWDYAFPSAVERMIWRVSSVAIVVLPALLILGLVFWNKMSDTGRDVVVCIMAFSGLAYVGARVLLLALSFTTLRSLPYEAYEAVQWTLLIPHFT
ncbi:hypothetical protein BV25DRAFT_1818295 [Artomyces pyxidatus]|uniref:Uncharacterized protein n=1 Tax=Artomyces pyxidatus TaxID=48021 RepID=A0ACB8TLG9_9AGAM|nr:hypothetical protein BV25DRAFT_1818295 [Artomyces pyxidatus]